MNKHLLQLSHNCTIQNPLFRLNKKNTMYKLNTKNKKNTVIYPPLVLSIKKCFDLIFPAAFLNQSPTFYHQLYQSSCVIIIYAAYLRNLLWS